MCTKGHPYGGKHRGGLDNDEGGLLPASDGQGLSALLLHVHLRTQGQVTVQEM